MTKKAIRIIIIATTVSALALLYFFVDARHSHFFPACPFYTITGFYCPGCGSQRAISSLLHGNFLQAVSYNLMLVLSLPLVLYSAFVHLLNVFRTRQVVQTIFYSPLFVRLFFVAVVLFGVLRNLHAYPFTLLAP